MPQPIVQRAVQRAGTFAELPNVLAAHDVHLADVFTGTGIDPAGLKPDSLLPIEGMLMALDRAASRLSCPHLGLLLGSRFETQMHGPIGRMMSTAPCLGAALTDFVTWQQGFSTAAVVYLSRFGHDVALGYGTYDRQSPSVRHLHDAVVAIGCRMIDKFTGGLVKPTGVMLSVRRPDDLGPYRKFLGVPVEFDQEQTCVLIDARDMDKSLPGADPTKRADARAELEALMANRFSTAAAKARHIIRPLLHEGRPSMAEAASVLGLHPRTLRRRLALENTSFQELRDEVRFTVARELLDMTDLPVAAVGFALAYSTHSAFVEAFHRWSGMTPSEWRRRQERGEQLD